MSWKPSIEFLVGVVHLGAFLLRTGVCLFLLVGGVLVSLLSHLTFFLLRVVSEWGSSKEEVMSPSEEVIAPSEEVVSLVCEHLVSVINRVLSASSVD